tara:strand:- start:1673 stop:1852 length:180 start_codon:yes stop_codon:yes gene_type:complete
MNMASPKQKKPLIIFSNSQKILILDISRGNGLSQAKMTASNWHLLPKNTLSLCNAKSKT